MPYWSVWLIAVASTSVCLFIWFRDARRVMLACKNTVESAAGQVECCRKRAAGMPDDAGRAAVLARSEDIYRQALDNYEQARKKPWFFCLRC